MCIPGRYREERNDEAICVLYNRLLHYVRNDGECVCIPDRHREECNDEAICVKYNGDILVSHQDEFMITQYLL